MTVSKIAIIGGSSVNTPEIFEALQHQSIEAEEICLIGRRAEKLDVVSDFSRRLIEELDLTPRITSTLDLHTGLDGAQFVINQVKVGGANVWHRCQHIMRAFGMDGQAVNHAGCVSNLNTVLEFGRAALKMCPDAWFIEFTNPCVTHAEAFARYLPELRVITGCNVPLDTRRQVAEVLERPLEERIAPATYVGGVEILWFGFNHCAWIQDVLLDDMSLMKDLIYRNAQLEKPVWDVSQIEQFGLIPVGDAPILFHSPGTPSSPEDEAQQATQFVNESVALDGEVLSLYADRSLRPTDVMSGKKRVRWYESAIVPIIAGLAGSAPRRYYSAWPAAEAMPDFSHLLVECGLTLCDDTVAPLRLQPMPRSIKAMCDLLRASEELTIIAAVTRSRKLFIEALAIHPSCRSLQQAERAVDMLIKEAGLELFDVVMC